MARGLEEMLRHDLVADAAEATSRSFLRPSTVVPVGYSHRAGDTNPFRDIPEGNPTAPTPRTDATVLIPSQTA